MLKKALHHLAFTFVVLGLILTGCKLQGPLPQTPGEQKSPASETGANAPLERGPLNPHELPGYRAASMPMVPLQRVVTDASWLPLAFVVPGLGFYPQIQGASYIWHTADAQGGGSASFTKTFTISNYHPGMYAIIEYWADDAIKVEFNSNVVADDPGIVYRLPQVQDVSQYLKSGTNTLTITGFDAPGLETAAVVAALSIYHSAEPFGLSADEYFSPGTDSEKRVNRIAITTDYPDEPWQLTVNDQTIASGKGKQAITWDGRIGGSQLPDGVYTLSLASAESSASVRTVIDTQAPSAKVMVEGKDDPGILDTIVPRFTLKLSDNLSKFDGVNAIGKIHFPQRPDGVTPRVYENGKSYDLATDTFTYEVPFQEDSILYPGDQHVSFTVSDKAGNKSDVGSSFSVGAKSNHFAGIPPFSTAYRSSVQGQAYRIQIVDDPKLYQAAEDAVQASNNIIKLSAPLFLRYTSIPGTIPNYYMFAAATTAGIVISYFDFQGTVRELCDAKEAVRIRTKIGTLTASQRCLDHIAQQGHSEMTATILADALASVKTNNSDWELWEEDNPSNKFHGRYFLIYKKDERIFCISISEFAGPGAMFITTGYGADCIKGVWPAAGLTAQWSYVVRKLTTFKKTEDTPLWLSDSPTRPPRDFYPDHLDGHIRDDGAKTYLITTDIPGKAIANPGKTIL